MNIETVLVLTKSVSIVALLFSILYTAGIVWRVEKKLDISYKFFFAAIVFLLASEILGALVHTERVLLIVAAEVLKALFALFFLLGTLWMRGLVRELDGEK